MRLVWILTTVVHQLTTVAAREHPSYTVTMEDVDTIDLTQDDVVPPPSKKKAHKINHKSECTDDIITEYLTLLKIRNNNNVSAKAICIYDPLHFTLMDKHGIPKMVEWHDGENPLVKDLVLFPLHTPALADATDSDSTDSGHWTLIVAFPKDKLIRSYDSLGQEHSCRLRQTLKYLEKLAGRYLVNFERKKWTLKGNAAMLPKQRNSVDCGFFLCYYAACLARGDDPCVLPRPRSREVELIRSAGYPVETHRTVTADGYLIVLHRIPRPQPARVVLYFHGLFGGSIDIVIRGPKTGLAFILSRAGFDVWLPNLRGNAEEQLTVNSTKKNPWDFSWDENAQYDFPAIMDYVLAKTGAAKVSTVGLSMAANVELGGLVLQPHLNRRINVMVLMAPTTRLKHIRSMIGKGAPYWRNFQVVTAALGLHWLPMPRQALKIAREIVSSVCRLPFFGLWLCTSVMFTSQGLAFKIQKKLVTNLKAYWVPVINPRIFHRIMSWLCSLPSVGVIICASIMFTTENIVFEIQRDLVPRLFEHYPHRGSTKSITHYLQIMNSGRFCSFDYGSDEENMKRYNQISPPDYDLKKVTAPTAIFYSHYDTMASPEDVEWLVSQLNSTVLAYSVPKRNFAHLSFMWDPNINNLVYDKVLEVLLKNW